jgi:hypothetical protein
MTLHVATQAARLFNVDEVTALGHWVGHPVATRLVA